MLILIYTLYIGHDVKSDNRVCQNTSKLEQGDKSKSCLIFILLYDKLKIDMKAVGISDDDCMIVYKYQ